MPLTAEQFNEKHPVGTKVKYFPIANEKENFIQSETRTEAWELGHGDVVVSIKGKAGGVSIEPQHLKIV